MNLYKLRVTTQEDVTIERENWDEATKKAQEMERGFRARTHHGERVTVVVVHEQLPT